MTASERTRRLQELVLDPEGAYPAIRQAIEEKLGLRITALISARPKPETAFGELLALHTLYLEYQALLDPEGFVRAFAPREE